MKELVKKGHHVTFVSPFKAKIPTENLTEVILTGFVEEWEGAPNIPSYMGPLVLEPPYHTTFWKRTYNFLIYVVEEIVNHAYVFPAEDRVLRKYIPDSPNIYDVIYNTSLVIFNSDSVVNQPIPTALNVIEIGGFHVRPPKELPYDLQKILDNAPDGVIYFSMGSVLKSKMLPLDQRRELLNTFSKLKQIVLWKFEEALPHLPPNVIIKSWFPQSDLLAHPNLKLFITHGGLLSIIESLYRGVPVVGIPVFGDQRMNIANAVIRGQGVMIPYGKLSEEKLLNAVNEVLYNPKYLENAKYSSAVLKDRLVNPIDEAEYWIEYVVRHKAGHSHYTVGHVLMEELAKRGHNVTFVSPYRPKEQIENLRDIVLTGIDENWRARKRNINGFYFRYAPAFLGNMIISYISVDIVETTLQHEEMQKLLWNGEDFDIVFVEQLRCEGLLAVANHFNAPFGLISAYGPSVWSNSFVGAPDIISYMGNVVTEPPYHTTFCKRIYNFLIYLIDQAVTHLYVYPSQNTIIHKHFPNLPHIYDIIYNISLIMYNSDSSYHQPLPIAPNAIEIGGFHVRPPKKLPDDLQEILDSASNGVIYFSMGSVLQSREIAPDTRRSILNVFSKLKETVLWKFEDDLPDLPPNVVIRKWFPQSDLLAHPYIKLFITHGGVLSTIESLYRSVPIVGVPVVVDQWMNMANAVLRGQGVVVPYSDLTEETFMNAIQEVLQNPKYSENVKYRSAVLKDRLVDPIDEVEYWIEYIVILWCNLAAVKILCVFPTAGYSHYSVGHVLMEELAKRGHDITFVSPFRPKEQTANLRDIVLTGFLEKWDEWMNQVNAFNLHYIPPILGSFIVASLSVEMVESTLEHEEMQKLLWSGEHFDIVFVEQVRADGLLAIGSHFGAPLGFISAFGPSVMSNNLVGVPDITSYMGNALIEPPYHVSFWKRTHSFLLYIVDQVLTHLYIYPTQNAIIHKHFPNLPHIYDIVYNASLIIYNSDSSYSIPFPIAPNAIEIGGYHVRPPKKLPADLQKIMDKATNGVIYFSMGSFLKTKEIPPEKRQKILNVLSKLKETVLWKFEADLPDLPPNVINRKWFPQSDLLAHPNVKLFITHGGILSTIEALYRGVPIVGIPVLGDQAMNMANAVLRGQGVVVPYSELTEETFMNAIQEVLQNPKYSENVKQNSAVLKDRMVDPVDEAEYWIEYVVRHKGAKHLRLASLDLTWYQHASLDVILFLIGVAVISFCVFYKIVRRLFGRKRSRKQKTN
ncbi:UDP-glucosyltransferase [Holotrichia oblita]|uniref:UDP-glucosyltransferase n=1 Tax=Holotrichia oblita TaxID=644536 RepID=A0ACB9T5J0_HOLOL|nr:UDP-glucosyltransferase [Holotrichia oblita]